MLRLAVSCLTFALFIDAVIPVAANASTLPITYTETELNAGANSPDSPVFDVGTTSASSTLSSAFGSSSFSGQASATSDFGILKLSAAASVINYDPKSFVAVCSAGPTTFCGPSGSGPVDLPARAFAGFTDSFTITGGTGDGYLLLTLSEDGTTSLSSDDFNIDFNSDAQGGLEVFDGDLFSSPVLASVSFFGGPHVYKSVPVRFTYGVPHTISVLAAAEISFEDASVSNPYSATGTADFSHTITVSNIQVFSDADGTIPVTNVALSSASGTVYPLDIASTPEPASWALMLSAILCMAIPLSRKARA